uniref:heavy metal-binding domain-containing protein n=1 Tax=Lentilactobacillus hilgardii TaxID=1588 RepID=UPI00403F6E89
MSDKKFIISTTEHIPGKEYDVIGEVFGLTTQSKNVVRNIGASLKNIVGGEIKDYTKMLDEAREVSVQRLQANAEKMGADAVVMMRFDSGSIGADMQSVAAYSTAVKYTN